ncbi:MAG TPA: 30S ribosomal protein S24e [Candidatus Thermoplasmatota archaeon]|nr:30S ribosomal protein S24e [Candidatus Thermoplasmatota archaeon]HVL86763.1 30S ribosomal protein S24e [Candidatus Thermoplasmatota archaeon]
MDIEIVGKKENALIGRTEVQFRILHTGAQTPKREDVRDKLAAILNAKKQNIVVDNMESTFGHGETTGYAKVYPSVEALSKVEPLHLLKRNKLEEHAPKKRKESQPAPAAKKAAAPRKK